MLLYFIIIIGFGKLFSLLLIIMLNSLFILGEMFKNNTKLTTGSLILKATSNCQGCQISFNLLTYLWTLFTVP